VALDLTSLVNSIQEFKGVTRKGTISNVTDLLSDVYNISGDVCLDFGDDASAIDIGNNQVILLAADGIWGQLLQFDPFWAGYCAVLVNVNDIAAMGGKPIAMVDILAVDNEKTCEEVIKGIKCGCEKFKVPMVGGHFHPDADYTSIDVAIVGIANKDKIISSSGANVGDKVLVSIDLDGKFYDEETKLNWDTTFDKDPILVRDQIRVMNKIAEEKLPSAGKDISNPGILGTLEMLLEASNVGAIVDLEKIPKNEDIPWEVWLKAYPGAGFVLTAPSENCQEIIDNLEKYNLTTKVVGDVINEKILYLENKNQKGVVFKQDENPVLKFNQIN
jgi:putative methanogenesis marker protein 2